MTGSSAIEDRRAAVHAYEHAGEAGHRTPHRVDLVDEPELSYGAPRRRSIPQSSHLTAPASQRIDHRFADPAATAFKVGFGFAAGAWVFRLAVSAGLAVLCLLLIAALVQSLS